MAFVVVTFQVELCFEILQKKEKGEVDIDSEKGLKLDLN